MDNDRSRSPSWFKACSASNTIDEAYWLIRLNFVRHEPAGALLARKTSRAIKVTILFQNGLTRTEGKRRFPSRQRETSGDGR